MEFNSRLIENAVTEVAKLPGIGKKTALRLVLHLLKQDESRTVKLSETLLQLKNGIRYCKTCHMLGDSEDCTCQPLSKENHLLCVVEDFRDVLAIRNTAQYNGLFHVLGGIISPIEGIGPEHLQIESLLERIRGQGFPISEIVLALPSTMEGETTAFYIAKKLQDFPVKISTIARGVPIGSDLEYADELTLGRSITARVAYDML